MDGWREGGGRKGVYSLHNMLQSMPLGLLKVVAPVQGIEPGVQEKLGPVSVPHDHASARQSFLVLRQDEVDPRPLQMREGLDHAVGWYDGLVDDHEGFEPRGVHDVLFERQGGRHDERGRGQVEEVGRVRVERHCVSQRWHDGPGGGGVAEGVVGGVGEESHVAYKHAILSVSDLRSRECIVPHHPSPISLALLEPCLLPCSSRLVCVYCAVHA